MDIEKHIGRAMKQEARTVRRSPDVRERILTKIDYEGEKNMKDRQSVFRKYALVSTVAAVFITGTTVYAAANLFDLFNKDGEKTATYQFDDKNLKISAHLYDKYAEELRKDLKPGSAVRFIVTDAKENPNRSILSVEKPVVYNDFEQLKKKAASFADISKELEGSFHFVSGFIHYDLKDDLEGTKQMYQEAEKSQQKMIVKEAEFDSTIRGVATTYKAGGKTVIVSLGDSGSVDNTFYQPNTSEGVEKVKLGGDEALFFEKQSAKDYRTIHWVTKNKLEVMVSSPDDVSKEELLEIAKRLNLSYANTKK